MGLLLEPPAQPSLCRSISSQSILGLKTPREWVIALGGVKRLYMNGQWRQCISACEEYLADEKAEIHPVNRTFLYFYVAISNESLGLRAHTYSAKKVPFLRRARDAFQAALDALPVAHFQLKSSYRPILDLFDDPFLEHPENTSTRAPRYKSPDPQETRPAPYFKSIGFPDTIEAHSKGFDLTCSPTIERLHWGSDIAPRLGHDIMKKGEPCPTALPQSTTLDDIEASLEGKRHPHPSPDSSIRKYNASLLAGAKHSSPALLPKPLAIRKTLPNLPGPPPAKALPPLPPVKCPQRPPPRQSGLGTTMQVLQDVRNQEKEKTWCPLPPIFAPTTPDSTPTKLHRHFLVAPDSPLTPTRMSKGGLSRPPSTPTAKSTTSQTPTKPVISPAIVFDIRALRCGETPPPRSPANKHTHAYMSYLVTLRPRISMHLSDISALITKTEALQSERQSRKSMAFQSREASYWLLSTGTAVGEKGNEEKEARIERLRREGWKVRKEKWGFKGEGWYAVLREKALDECAGICRE